MGSQGGYFGYKTSGSQYVDEKGTPDCSEFWNIAKDDILRVGSYRDSPLKHPMPIHRRWDQLEDFMTAGHRVVTQILRVLGEQLGLDPDVLPNLHKIDRTGGDQARITHAPPISADTISLGEHTGMYQHISSRNGTELRKRFLDFGSVTVLFNQLGGLQVINPDSYEWKYVKPIPNTAIINLGDALVKLVGGRLYSGVHRVVGPPGQQGHNTRHSVVYFSRPNGDVKLRSLLDDGDAEEENVMTADAWIAHRARLRNTANFKDAKTFLASRGTEHLKDRDAATIEKSSNMVRVT